ncbi:SOS response-associated peptidase [Shewanella acanthi]|uniref:SOS response-associated peptidase n=1 Tax=Shewanella acanthi TaxID=2864212 RepID=UPI001C659921|nr:SOS response-associated peptidase family protein [Shewanella acanthi]QYJ80466.1 SOS response-associated peptidase [Shewanella acanthi]
MCGRLSIDGLAIADRVSAQIGSRYSPQTNLDLRPTEQISAIVTDDTQFKVLTCAWGIKPLWSKTLLINAQSESVREKKTFAKAFSDNRCLIPCSGWYEWRAEGGKKKQKYLFSEQNDAPLYMAGILYEFTDVFQVVTLTTKPTEQCAQYHSRMPLLIPPNDMDFWLRSSINELEPLLMPPVTIPIKIQPCS